MLRFSCLFVLNLAFLLIQVPRTFTAAQAHNCDEVIKQGVFRTFEVQQQEDVRMAYLRWLKHAEYEDVRRVQEQGFNVTVPVEGVPVNLGADFTKDDWQRHRKEVQERESKWLSESRFYSQFESRADETLLRNWLKCRELEAARLGLTAKVDKFAVQLQWSPVTGAEAPPPISLDYSASSNIDDAASKLPSSLKAFTARSFQIHLKDPKLPGVLHINSDGVNVAPLRLMFKLRDGVEVRAWCPESQAADFDLQPSLDAMDTPLEIQAVAGTAPGSQVRVCQLLGRRWIGYSPPQDFTGSDSFAVTCKSSDGQKKIVRVNVLVGGTHEDVEAEDYIPPYLVADHPLVRELKVAPQGKFEIRIEPHTRSGVKYAIYLRSRGKQPEQINFGARQLRQDIRQAINMAQYPDGVSAYIQAQDPDNFKAVIDVVPILRDADGKPIAHAEQTEDDFRGGKLVRIDLIPSRQ